MKPVRDKIKKGDEYGDFVALTDLYVVVKNYFSSRQQRYQPARYLYVKLQCRNCGAEKESSATAVGEKRGVKCRCNPLYKRPKPIVDETHIDQWFKDLLNTVRQSNEAKKLRRA